jgi:putative SOS response-associated peptidase YedK
MCGRFFRYDISWEDYRAWLNIIPPANIAPPEAKFNIAPMSLAPIIYENEHRRGEFELAPAMWSLVPSWWRKPLSEKKFSTFNARSETVNESNTFKASFRHFRCLIPMSGYYEWSGPKGSKTPFAIGLRNRKWFCCAGLWNRAMIEGSELDTFTLLTTVPNDATAGIHSRMPVIIDPSDYERWLTAPYKDVYDLMRPYPSIDVHAWPVKPDVGNVRNQGPDLIEEA